MSSLRNVLVPGIVNISKFSMMNYYLNIQLQIYMNISIDFGNSILPIELTNRVHFVIRKLGLI